MGVTTLDYGIFAILLFHAFMGLKRGFSRIVFEIIAIFGGFMLGLRHYDVLAVTIESVAGLPYIYASLISFCAIWGVLYIGISLLSKLVNSIIFVSGFGLINRLGGMILGTAKGAFIALPIIVPLVFFNVSIIHKSLFLQPVKPLIENYIQNQLAVSEYPEEPMTNSQ
jgi:uncharacterized membrane protein required for colicin V production